MLQVGQKLAAEIIFADGAYHLHLRAQAGGGHGLIGTFAAHKALKAAAQKRFAHLWEARRAGDQIHIDAADNGDFGCCHKVLAEKC